MGDNNSVNVGAIARMVVNQTPFYAEAGGKLVILEPWSGMVDSQGARW